MSRAQHITEGVTVTWAGLGPEPRRRIARRAGPVSLRAEPVRSPLPTADQLERVRRGGRHEHLAALLAGGGVTGGSADPEDLQSLARSLHAQGFERDTLLLALVELGYADPAALAAVWWGNLDDKRTVVRALLRHAGWPGERVHDALSVLGLPAWERSGVVDPLR